MTMDVEEHEHAIITDVTEVQAFVDGEMVFHHSASDDGEISMIEVFDDDD